MQAFVQAKGDQKAMTKATTWVAECCNATPPAFLRGGAVAARQELVRIPLQPEEREQPERDREPS